MVERSNHDQRLIIINKDRIQLTMQFILSNISAIRLEVIDLLVLLVEDFLEILIEL